MKIIMAVLMFFVLGTLLIISNNNLALYNSENSKKFSDLWIDWIDKTFSNLKSVTGYAISLDWEPE